MLADDTTLHNQGWNIDEIQQSLQDALNNVADWRRLNHMSLNSANSKAMLITTRQKHQRAPLSLDLVVNGNNIKHVESHKRLGVLVDNKLSWHSYIGNLCETLSTKLLMLYKLQSIITAEGPLPVPNHQLG